MSMYRFRDTWMSAHALPFSRLCFALSLILVVPSLAVFVCLPAEVSILLQPDGSTRWFFNRQFDLPTGDPAVFYDYSLAPLFWCFGGCAVFYFATHRFILRYAA